MIRGKLINLFATRNTHTHSLLELNRLVATFFSLDPFLQSALPQVSAVPTKTAFLLREKHTDRFSTDTLISVITFKIGLHMQFSVQDHKEVAVLKAIIMPL